MAIRWEELRAKYFGVTQQLAQLEECRARQELLKETLKQAVAEAKQREA